MTLLEELQNSRTCVRCNRTAPEIEFVWASSKRGYRNRCLNCERKRKKKYYEENKHLFVIRDSHLTDKMKARNKVRVAIARGKLKRGDCEVCGAPNGDGHHDDYTKPMDVRWLCKRHHSLEHRKLKK